MSDLVADQSCRQDVLLPFIGEEITRVSFDYAVSLLFLNGIELRIEAPFSIYDADAVVTVDPEGEPLLAGVALRLSRRVVQDAAVTVTGVLEIAVSGDLVVRVPPSKKYESWDMSGPHGVMVVSIPGGELAVWSDVSWRKKWHFGRAKRRLMARSSF